MRNIKIILEYDGTAYCGWQRQKNGKSIQQVLEEAVGLITGEKVTVTAAGRTDAGVHALNQVAHFKCKSGLPVHKLLAGINSVLPKDVVLKRLNAVSEDFHSLRDAKGKIYVYRIFNKRFRPVLGRNYLWHVPYALDIEKMKRASVALLGRHDFSSFCAAGTDVKDCVRMIKSIKIRKKPGGVLEIQLEAGGFLRHMVRNIVGTLVEVGRGKIPPDEMKKILDAKDRNVAGPTAPAQGLLLKEVRY
ncbi:MAG TPA: tRNA pseudouridine(38-40) synthase TruA [Smithella sp.]|nr:tRNA pseudouridine(38-40) synthase TruA [Smithella sp.]